MALQYLFDAAVEPFDHAIGPRRLCRGQAVLDVKRRTEPVELVCAGCRALLQAKEAIGEFLAIVGKNRSDPDRASTRQVAQEAPGIGRGLGIEDANEHPAPRTVDRDEQVASSVLIAHLRQILHVDMEVPGLIGLERLVFGFGRPGFKITQIAYAMATQTAIQPRA